MAAQGPTLDTIAQCLQQTLNPANRKQAEQQLQSFERTPHFTLSLLTLVDTSSVDQHVRFAASVLFKNLVKKYWDDSDTAVLPEDDRTTIKQRIVKLMISLPTKLQLQVSDALSIIADA
ncbi:importin-alpha export receptor, partial [Dimargaris xerosporica]